MKAYWEDGNPIAGVDFAVAADGTAIWSLEANFDITSFKSKKAGKNALGTLRFNFPDMPDCIDKPSASKLMLYRSYAFAQLKNYYIPWRIPAAICLISHDSLIAADADAWAFNGKPADWSSPGKDRLNLAVITIAKACDAFLLADL